MGILSRITGHVPAIDVAAAHDRPLGVLLIDVREPNEWAAGHAPGAYHRPLGELDPAKLPAADAIYVICQSGGRSARATRLLTDVGIDAHNVTGGMTAWNKAGLPVEHR